MKLKVHKSEMVPLLQLGLSCFHFEEKANMWQEHRDKRTVANQGQNLVSSPWKHILYVDFLAFEIIHPFMFEPIELEFIMINS